MKNYISLDNKPEDNEETAIKNSFKLLSHEAIKSKIIGQYFLGGYLHGFQYIVAINNDGSLEGKNNVDHYDVGQWSIEPQNNTLRVHWENGWDSTTTRVYEQNGKFNMYDSETGLWRTTFNHSIPAVSSIKNYLFKPA